MYRNIIQKILLNSLTHKITKFALYRKNILEKYAIFNTFYENIYKYHYNILMLKEFLLHGLDIAHIPYKKNEPLYNKCTFKVGSTADIFVTPETTDQLQSAAGASVAAEQSFFILGGGSNIVFPDEPYTHILISTEKLNSILMTDDIPDSLNSNQILVTCECGTPMSAFVNFCTSHNLTGAEQFAGLPGTIGGAVYMNARCFDKSISDLIYETKHIEVYEKGKTKVFTTPLNTSEWDYKKSPFQTSENSVKKIISEVTFVLEKTDSTYHSTIEENCKKYINERIDKGHFKFPSAGSVFKNNRNFGKPSGVIIDEAGLKGYQIGGAQIAPFHGNFIINVDKAKADDIEALVKFIQTTIKQKFNFDLEPEIIFIKN